MRKDTIDPDTHIRNKPIAATVLRLLGETVNIPKRNLGNIYGQIYWILGD